MRSEQRYGWGEAKRETEQSEDQEAVTISAYSHIIFYSRPGILNKLLHSK